MNIDSGSRDSSGFVVMMEIEMGGVGGMKCIHVAVMLPLTKNGLKYHFVTRPNLGHFIMHM